VWAGRRDVVTPEVVADFLASREYGLANIADIAEGAALKLELPPNPLERYLRESIDFNLTPENVAALEYYFARCAEAGLIPAARPIEFAVAPQPARQPTGARAD
jgi:predicted solute-binding protein